VSVDLETGEPGEIGGHRGPARLLGAHQHDRVVAGDRERYEVWTEEWPADVRDFARRLAEGAFL
jgi:hypothetical protein